MESFKTDYRLFRGPEYLISKSTLLSFKEIHSITENVNAHMEHLEDEIFNGGYSGAVGAINYLFSLTDMLQGKTTGKFNVTVKWDGAPSIICGNNPENGRFFVATKSIFTTKPKINYTAEDVLKNHDGGLAEKLVVALTYLPSIGIKGIVQGDMLFSSGDKVSQKINGQDHITFQPNTIVYAVKTNSNLGRIISRAHLGIVFHTSYNGNSLSGLKASFGVDISRLKKLSSVWVADASFRDVSGTASLTKEETSHVTELLLVAKSTLSSIDTHVLDMIAKTEPYSTLIKTYYNSLIRTGSKKASPAGLVQFLEDRYANIMTKNKPTVAPYRNAENEKKHSIPFFRAKANQLQKIFFLHDLLDEIKLILLRKLQQAESIGTFLPSADGLRATAPEGFVAIDHLSNKAVKLVDRLEFSMQNFNNQKFK